MCRTTDVSFHSSNSLNKWWWWNDNTGVWSLVELVSLYTVPLSAVNGLSRLTRTTNGQAWPIPNFSNRPITFKSNRIGTANSNSNQILKLWRSLEWVEFYVSLDTEKVILEISFYRQSLVLVLTNRNQAPKTNIILPYGAYLQYL